MGRREDKSEIVGDGIKGIPYGPFPDGLRRKLTGQFGTLRFTTRVKGGVREAFALFHNYFWVVSCRLLVLLYVLGC